MPLPLLTLLFPVTSMLIIISSSSNSLSSSHRVGRISNLNTGRRPP
jgi:hypothetical protein